MKVTIDLTDKDIADLQELSGARDLQVAISTAIHDYMELQARKYLASGLKRPDVRKAFKRTKRSR